jgi:replicative DNA helicase
MNMLMGWWDTNPEANIAIATGKRSGVIVIDVDAGHGGEESLSELIRQHGDLPQTPTVKTGGGGRHIFFAHPGIEIRNSTSRLAPGIDVRGDGGYVVTAPSIHPSGNAYKWIVKPSETPLAPLPEWIVEKLKDTPQINVPVISNGVIANGTRNNTLTSLAGSMRKRGFDEDAIFSALMVHNKKYCSPPLSDGDVLVIARSISRYEPQAVTEKPLYETADVIEQLEAEIIERQRNPVDVWGIHYAWPFLSMVTGGKQKGELIILAGEPGVGKSWWAHQDAMYTAIGNPDLKIYPTPVLVWSGEMPQKQVFRRMFQMLGVPKRRMLTGNMSDTDWQIFREAKAILMNSPLYISDIPLDLKDLRSLLEREIREHGIEQAVFDYDWLINAPGDSEIQTSQNISRACKQLARELNISLILISSVNKMGMDTTSENVSKSNVSGSGKKLHDADIIYVMTKFNKSKNADMSILPEDYDNIATLHISKGRELDFHVPNKAINYMREKNNPKFRELKDMSKREIIPSWLDRADMGDD